MYILWIVVLNTKRKEIIIMADFMYKEGVCASKDLLKTFKGIITTAGFPFDEGNGESEVLNTWEVLKETLNVDGVSIDELIIKGVVSMDGQTQDIFFKIANLPVTDGENKFSSWDVTMLGDAEGTGAETTFGLTGAVVHFEWSDYEAVSTERTADSPVYYYITMSNNKIAIVVESDPVVNFEDTKKSFCYMGAITPFEQNASGELLDISGNCLLTAGSVNAEDTQPVPADPDYFGAYTSLGNTTFQMLKTKSTVPYQKHYPAYITQAPATTVPLEAQGFQASRWTKRYHLSPVYVYHPYEGYRGSLEGVIAVTNHNILHLDELVVDVTGKAYDQEVYQFFSIDVEHNFAKTSPNDDTGVALLKEIRYNA